MAVSGNPSYSLMMNQVPVTNYPPPHATSYYEPRPQTATNPQYYSHHPAAPEYHLGTGYSTSPQFRYQLQAVAQQPPPQLPPTSSQFNPTAQAFLPSSESVAPGPFPTPPPTIIGPAHHLHHHSHSGTIPGRSVVPLLGQERVTEPNLMLSLKSPPKPLAFNRTQEPRKSFPDRPNRSSEESLVSSRLSDKNNLNGNIALRLNRNSSSSCFKPPSMIEMQSGSLTIIGFYSRNM